MCWNSHPWMDSCLAFNNSVYHHTMVGNMTKISLTDEESDDRQILFERPKKNLRELVQDALREAILDLRFVPGERLVERTLCAQLGVSRTVVREVLRYLEAEGLVEISPNRGPVVATIKPEEAEQIYEIRILLEGMAAASCAELATDDDLKQLSQSMEGLLQARERNDPRLCLRATNGFYHTVFAVSQKQVAWKLVEGLYLRINALRGMTITTADRQVVGVSEMQELFEAICAHDPERARAAAVEHVKQAAVVARRLLAQPAEGPAATLPIFKERA